MSEVPDHRAVEVIRQPREGLPLEVAEHTMLLDGCGAIVALVRRHAEPINPVALVDLAMDMARAEQPFRDEALEMAQSIPSGWLQKLLKAGEIEKTRQKITTLESRADHASELVRGEAARNNPGILNQLYRRGKRDVIRNLHIPYRKPYRKAA